MAGCTIAHTNIFLQVPVNGTKPIYLAQGYALLSLDHRCKCNYDSQSAPEQVSPQQQDTRSMCVLELSKGCLACCRNDGAGQFEPYTLPYTLIFFVKNKNFKFFFKKLVCVRICTDEFARCANQPFNCATDHMCHCASGLLELYCLSSMSAKGASGLFVQMRIRTICTTARVIHSNDGFYEIM